MNLQYWKKEFGKLDDRRLLLNTANLNTFSMVASFKEEDKLTEKDIQELFRFLVEQILSRKLHIPSKRGYVDLVKIGYDIGKKV